MHSPMRTPLGRVRGLGSARSGTHHFFLQRLTALGNLILTVAFLIIVMSVLGESYSTVHTTLANPVVAVIMLLALLSVTVHMRLGMQVVIEDYIHTEGMKVALVIGNTFFTTVIGLAGAFAVLKISLGG
ncbi:succinate dehydrogenase, hydrophobic membrane anchor protein [Azorhizobium oxalatiphilum]|uniref:Succinate dehydrogenase hydrophobic membrane anchor subunit n=1 Tax=Azorhizobium oxalatiphilum TaxID=980631 RepID=A0A917F5M2_9HYPH|nr:succinate dehydrogenase, hydrophobic membrane anchor protein [Azorhizobium oxalatiphilum]GGF52172.1 succinate dehydrogenase, hydrophobic membrane anchor protein [Azorhizobium oxalatiphilum]